MLKILCSYFLFCLMSSLDPIQKYIEIEENIWNMVDNLEEKIDQYLESNEKHVERIEFLIATAAINRPIDLIKYYKILYKLEESYGYLSSTCRLILNQDIYYCCDDESYDLKSLYANSTLENIVINDDVATFLEKLENNDPIYLSFFTHKQENVPITDAAAYFGSLNIFKALILNKFQITSETFTKAIIGGNYEIVHLCERFNTNMRQSINQAVISHRNEILDWLLERSDEDEIDASLIISSGNNILIESKNINYQCNDVLLEAVKIGHNFLNLIIQKSNFEHNEIMKCLEYSISMNDIDSFNVLLNHYNLTDEDILMNSISNTDFFKIKYDELKKDSDDFVNIIKICLAKSIEQNTQIFRFLADKCFNLSFVNDNNETLLFDAAKKCHDTSIIEYLVRRGLDVNQQNSSRNTPLKVAVMNENLSIISVLIRSGADPLITNNKGESAITLAKNNHQILRILGNL